MMTKSTCETYGKLPYSQSLLCQIICAAAQRNPTFLSPEPSRPSRTPKTGNRLEKRLEQRHPFFSY